MKISEKHHPICPRCTGNYKVIASLKIKISVCPKCNGRVFEEIVNQQSDELIEVKDEEC